MGTTFRYVADSVLPEYARRDVCDWCKREADLFRIYIEEPGVPGMGDEACVSCIRTLPLRWILPRDDERLIAALINKRHPKGTKSQSQRFALTVEMCDDYRRTPLLPNFIQNADWPSCCADFTEFMGDAGRTFDGPYDGFEWWGYDNDAAIEHGIEGMMGGEDRVSLFSCPRCSRKYWTFQCT